jgi:hypothetical protein
VDEADDDFEEILDRLIDEEPAVVIRGVTPATAVLFRNMVRTMNFPPNVRSEKTRKPRRLAGNGAR